MNSKNNKILGLRTTIYHVADIQKAKIWYEKAFEISPYFVEDFYVGFNIEGFELGLQPTNENNETGHRVISYWGVDDIHQKFDHFIKTGAKIHEEPTNVGGDIMVASVLDPWNNCVGLIFNPHFKS